MSVFVDTSAWYAAADRGDRSNRNAKRVLSAGEALVTTDHVLVESWLLLNHRLGRDAAERFWQGIRQGVAALEPVTAADLEAAWSIRDVFPDQRFSLVDRTSFAVMLRLGIGQVATFDDDFAVFRYGPGRRRAFELLR